MTDMPFSMVRTTDDAWGDPWAIQAPEPMDVQLIIHNSDGKGVIRINPSKGTVEIDDSMTVDDAAREFWAAVQKLAPR